MPATQASKKRAPGRPRKHVTKCFGVLRPDSIYTVEGVLRAAGIGREVLREARQSGMVKPVEIGRRMYYLGAELVEWIRSRSK